MKVLFTTAEAVPFAKVGGLADVMGSLPAALRARGIDARVIMPGYGFIPHFKYGISLLFTFTFHHRLGSTDVHVYSCIRDGVPVYFIQAWPYFGEDGTVYSDWDWDVPRFIFFNQVVMAAAEELQARLGWFPEVINCNDWHTGLIPFLVAQNRHQQHWSNVATLITIHNIAYQGNGVGGFLWNAGVTGRHHDTLDALGLSDNLLGIAIAYSDIVTTVSPRYATEIQYPHAGFELAALIRSRADDLYGILNGIDLKLWDPGSDQALVSNYDFSNFETMRPPNKRHLQSIARLPMREDVPVIGVVSRLTWQKGLDMALPALRRLMLDTDMQFIVLGTGDPDMEAQIRLLERDFSWKVRAFLQYDGALAQAIYGGSDIFLMPSHFEPCGMGQLIAMRYGALPLVRATGGLADTVVNYDSSDAVSGTGFVFEWEEADAVAGTLRWAIATYHDRPDAWRTMQRRAMQADFSWDVSAQQYIELFEKALNKHAKERA